MRLKALLMAFIILGIVIPSSSTVSQPFEDYLKDQERLLNQFVEMMNGHLKSTKQTLRRNGTNILVQLLKSGSAMRMISKE